MERPITRKDCALGSRPCPYVSCKHHMVWFFPEEFWRKSDDEVVEKIFTLPYSCVLDVIDVNRECILEDIGFFTELSRERVRQLLDGAGKKWGAIARFKFQLHKMLSPQEIQSLRESVL